jgi:peptidoglycan/xylan/chitin deacetylase (PgdA/CDA1 family)
MGGVMTDREADVAMHDAHPAAAMVHIDLDGARHIFRLRGWRWPGGDDPAWQTGVLRALDTFDAYGIQATFFLIAEDLDDAYKLELMREALRRGHDVASHSLTHAPLAGLDAASKCREIADSRKRIEDALGTRVDGFRAPFFSVDAESMDMMEDAGYAWDSSVLPGRAVPGLPAAAKSDGTPWRPRGGDLIELPLPPYRPLPFPFHPSYSLVLGARYFDMGLSRHVRRGTPFVLLFHLIDFADPLPPAMLHGWKQRLFTLSQISAERKRDACHRILDAVTERYAFANPAAIVQAARNTKRNST